MASHRRRMSHFIATQKAGLTAAPLDDLMERPLPMNWYGRSGCQCPARQPCHTLHTQSMPAALHAYCEGLFLWILSGQLEPGAGDPRCWWLAQSRHIGWASADKASWILSELYFATMAWLLAGNSPIKFPSLHKCMPSAYRHLCAREFWTPRPLVRTSTCQWMDQIWIVCPCNMVGVGWRKHNPARTANILYQIVGWGPPLDTNESTMCIYVYVCTYMYVYVCKCTYMCTYIHICICMYKYIHICTWIFTYVHIYVHIYVQLLT